MSLKNKLFIFWGMMDVLALVSYLFFSLRGGNIPFYSDIKDFYTAFAQFGVDGLTSVVIQVLFFINIALIISLVFSGWSFLVKKNINTVFFAAQECARLFSLKCSIAVIPLVMHFVDFSAPWGAMALFLLSEALKIGSVVWAKRSDKAQPAAHPSR